MHPAGIASFKKAGNRDCRDADSYPADCVNSESTSTVNLRDLYTLMTCCVGRNNIKQEADQVYGTKVALTGMKIIRSPPSCPKVWLRNA
jgi:hypothetical protein